MENIHIIRVAYATSRKGRMLGVFQIGIVPAIIMALCFYLAFDAFTANNVLIIGMVLIIVLMTFGMIGYEMGPAYISKRTMRKLSRIYFNY